MLFMPAIIGRRLFYLAHGIGTLTRAASGVSRSGDVPVLPSPLSFIRQLVYRQRQLGLAFAIEWPSLDDIPALGDLFSLK